LGEKCRLPSGLKRKEAERLTQEYIDQARRLLTWLVESSDNVHEQLQFRFRLMDLDRFESNQDYPEVATELIQEMKAQFAIDPNDEARRWLVITLINEANT